MVLSAQATDAGVNKATPALFAAADTPAKMAALGEERVRELIKTIGLFRTKAKNVVALSQKLVAEHGGEVPRTREALEALPGVGRKTANVVLNIAFGEPTIAVDTHIFRVGNRTGLAPGKTPLEVEMKLDAGGAGAIQAPRPPLADPARPLHLRRAPAAVREVPDRRPVQVAGEDGLLTCVRARCAAIRDTRSRPRWCHDPRSHNFRVDFKGLIAMRLSLGQDRHRCAGRSSSLSAARSGSMSLHVRRRQRQAAGARRGAAAQAGDPHLRRS